MTWLLLLLTSFTLNPTYSNVEYTKQDKTAIVSMINKSNYLKECSITWLLWQKKWTIVLGMICTNKTGIYNAKMWIDYKNLLYVRQR